MPDVNWKARSSDEVHPLLLQISGATRAENSTGRPPYVRAVVADRRAPLVGRPVDTNPGDNEHEVTVATEHRVEHDASVQLFVASRGEFLRWRALHHRDGRLELAAGLCSLVAALLAGSLTIGRYAVLIPMSGDALAGVQAAAVLFAAAAAVLLLVKSMGASPPGS
ncbi:hypothetical protein SAMN05660359_04470 [Geodermatophilus obscurus]|uniref:Uncharacterized protein n=1 Tax=Geodermatophilus obscurus TaxID=1861 RepID=A0A1I5IBQ0_9ACTN|nr:hypothetical protein [Geodermatophilus obscurus]SFO57933.1 hypothetical protein SAMN05660359_04470 [Geodermatophilus obscurus]